MSKEIWIGSDHGGYELKKQIIESFTKEGYSFKDVGCYSTDIVRYPYFAETVATAVASGEAERGILICSTGIGMSIIANKYKGIRAALCTSSYMAKMTRKHNDSNILCLGGKITGEFEAIDMVNHWLTTEFEGGRHCISLGLIADVEEMVMPGSAKKVLDTTEAK